MIHHRKGALLEAAATVTNEGKATAAIALEWCVLIEVCRFHERRSIELNVAPARLLVIVSVIGPHTADRAAGFYSSRSLKFCEHSMHCHR